MPFQILVDPDKGVLASSCESLGTRVLKAPARPLGCCYYPLLAWAPGSPKWLQCPLESLRFPVSHDLSLLMSPAPFVLQ